MIRRAKCTVTCSALLVAVAMTAAATWAHAGGVKASQGGVDLWVPEEPFRGEMSLLEKGDWRALPPDKLLHTTDRPPVLASANLVAAIDGDQKRDRRVHPPGQPADQARRGLLGRRTTLRQVQTRPRHETKPSGHGDLLGPESRPLGTLSLRRGHPRIPARRGKEPDPQRCPPRSTALSLPSWARISSTPPKAPRRTIVPDRSDAVSRR